MPVGKRVACFIISPVEAINFTAFDRYGLRGIDGNARLSDWKVGKRGSFLKDTGCVGSTGKLGCPTGRLESVVLSLKIRAVLQRREC
jgi:hypothetical protein